MFKGKRVLLLDAYARQTLPMLRGFKKLGCIVTVACYSKLDIGYASRYPDYRLILDCSKDDHDKQYVLVRELIESGNYDLVVPMNDYAAIYLSEHKEHLQKFARIAVNDKTIFDLVINKLNTMKICEEFGIESPKTIFTNDIQEIFNRDDLKFPLVVKPCTACGSIGFNIIENRDNLELLINSYNGSVGQLFVQEYIPQNGAQYGAEAFRNKDGSYSFILIDEKPRWFPLDGGSPTINVTIHNDIMKNMTKQLLDAIGWVGYANIDFVVDCRDNKPKIIEINGRISAAVSIDEAVGINVPELICQCEFGKKMTVYEDYPDNLKVSCILTELLWFFKSGDRFKNKPSMFSRKNTIDVIFRWNDIVPFFTFCIQSVLNYREAMRKRKRA